MFVIAIIGAVISAVSAFSQMEAQRKQQEYQAKVAKANATAKQQQALLTRKKTEVAQRAVDEEKKDVKRNYESAAGTNRSLLAAGNLDLTSGSALDLLEGNFNRFADDMGELEYDKALKGWEGSREAQLQEFEADVDLSKASFLSSAAGSTGDSLLAGGLAGGSSFASSFASSDGFK
jgi:hypothetical protein